MEEKPKIVLFRALLSNTPLQFGTVFALCVIALWLDVLELTEGVGFTIFSMSISYAAFVEVVAVVLLGMMIASDFNRRLGLATIIGVLPLIPLEVVLQIESPWFHRLLIDGFSFFVHMIGG
ncbi:MAG: hypothetical protein JRM77_09465 [Nitrososphaerota archaeon]|nr:hypothetical protein [Nitrososphaerota archaeon]